MITTKMAEKKTELDKLSSFEFGPKFFGEYHDYERGFFEEAYPLYDETSTNIMAKYTPDPESPDEVIVENVRTSPHWLTGELSESGIIGRAHRTNRPNVLVVKFTVCFCIYPQDEYRVLDYEIGPDGKYSHLFIGGTARKEKDPDHPEIYRWVLTRKKFKPHEKDDVIRRFEKQFHDEFKGKYVMFSS